ncbi:MAG: methyltransferase domain-containing protein [Thermodesulfobacteriota bacterium]
MSGIDVICDLEDSNLPFTSNIFDEVNASHILEHIVNLDNVLNEISRVMKPGAKLQITLPYAGCLRAFQDPTHVRFFTLRTFEYYINDESSVGGWYQRKYFKRITRRHLVFGRGPISLLMSIVVNRSQHLLYLYESSILRIIPARDLQVELEK